MNLFVVVWVILFLILMNSGMAFIALLAFYGMNEMFGVTENKLNKAANICAMAICIWLTFSLVLAICNTS